MKELEMVINEKRNEVKEALAQKSNEWLRMFIEKAVNNADELTLDDMFIVQVVGDTLQERMID